MPCFRNQKQLLARRAIDLRAAIALFALDMLAAMRAEDFDFSHVCGLEKGQVNRISALTL
jgi:hypothetical protein